MTDPQNPAEPTPPAGAPVPPPPAYTPAARHTRQPAAVRRASRTRAAALRRGPAARVRRRPPRRRSPAARWASSRSSCRSSSQLVALILGIIALVQSKKAGHKNGWAVAAIIICVGAASCSASSLHRVRGRHPADRRSRPSCCRHARQWTSRHGQRIDGIPIDCSTAAGNRRRTEPHGPQGRAAPRAAGDSVEDAAVRGERADAVDAHGDRRAVAQEHLRVARVAGAAGAARRDERARQQRDRPATGAR